MGLLKNKKGVEGLPLRYIIIALVAALVIGIALQFVGVLRGGTISAAEKINETLTEKTTCELDEESPVITINSITCNATSDVLSVDVTITDDCGVKTASFIDSDTDTWTDLTLSSGDEKDGVWTGSLNGTFSTNEDVTVTISAFDKAPTENQGTEAQQVTCT